MARAYRGGPYDYQQQQREDSGGADPYDMRRVSNSRHDAVARPHGIPNHFDREQGESQHTWIDHHHPRRHYRWPAGYK